MKRGRVNYKYIEGIASHKRATRSSRMKKLEGCIRRIMTDIMHKPPSAKKERDLYEYKFVEIARKVRDMYKA